MSWRFVLQPKWVVRHVAVAALVVSMTLLGFWQLSRLQDRKTFNALVAGREHLAAIPVEELVPVAASTGDPAVDRVAYRAVLARGRYADHDTVVVENHTLNGRSGAWVLTPLELSDGTAVVVNRGFVDFDQQGEIVPPPAPDGLVTVHGLLLPGEQRGSFGPTDAPTGHLAVLARVDLDRVQAQVDYPVRRAYIQRASSKPGEPPVPAGSPAVVALPTPVLDEGPHFSYAMQWFIFTTIAAGGYVLVLRRAARDQGRERAAEAAELREPARGPAVVDG